MEHFRSTIVTTAVLVAGLISATHVLHPHDPASEMRRGNLVVAATDSATAWSDPPARVSQAATTDAALFRPASFTLLPIAMTASLSAAEDQPQVRPVRRAGAVHTRPVQSGRRNPAAASAGLVERQASSPVATAAQPVKSAQGDPIGDLMKALGLGRDSEG